MYRDYSAKNVRFYYIYKALAHPETNGYVTPFSLEERLKHVAEARRTIGSEIPWLCDTMANDAKHSLGDAPNSEFVVDPEGRIVVRRAWSNPAELRRDLERLVGPVENPTTIEQLHLKTEPRPRTAAKGVVPRPELPGGNLRPVKIQPGESRRPFYAKLRVEADDGALRQSDGRLLVTFHLDPLYDVHWNNLDTPLRWEAEPSEGFALSPAKGESPAVDVLEDADPREFVVRVTPAARTEKRVFRLTVKYLVCQNDDGGCISVTQTYDVHLEPDPDAGRVQRRGSLKSEG